MHPSTVALGSAAAWARRIGSLPLVACDAATAADAWAGALALRQAGTRYYAAIAVPDPRVAPVRRFAETSIGQVGSIDALRLVIDEFEMKRLDRAQRDVPSAHQIAGLQEIVRMSDGIVVRSWAEHARLLGLIGSIDRPSWVVVEPDRSVPSPSESARTEILVWGPDETVGALGGYLCALQDIAVPVTVVAAQTVADFDRFRFCTAADAAAAFARAGVIVDATRNDPGVALALAAHGRPLAVSIDGGANELLDRVTLYEPWNRRSILAACSNAFGCGAPVPRALPVPPPPPQPLPPPAPAPLVSVVVATYNRADLLEETLASIEAQTYPAFETIVVNDAGDDVTDVVVRHRRARLVTTPRNLGPAGARNVGLREARGTYVIFFDDDDLMFPDHLAELAGALERSGLDVAYGQMVNGLFSRQPGGRYALDGFQAFDAILDHSDMEWACAVAVTAVMFRRSVTAEVGEVDEALVGASDYDFYLRLTRQRPTVRVPAVTSLYRWRTDASNMSARARGRLLAAHRKIYEKYPSRRALVTAGRDEMLATLMHGAEQDAPWPAWALAARDAATV